MGRIFLCAFSWDAYSILSHNIWNGLQEKNLGDLWDILEYINKQRYPAFV